MDFKRLKTTLCVFSMMLLFMQCEKDEMIVKKEYPTVENESQNPHAKKPDKPPGQDKTVYEYATISGDVSGEGYFTTGEPFTLTFGGPFPAGTHTGEIRIMATTKKHGENRIDFWYTDDDEVDKCLVMRKANPNDAYDPSTGILTLDINDIENPDDVALIGWSEDGEPVHIDYKPAYAMVLFSESAP